MSQLTEETALKLIVAIERLEKMLSPKPKNKKQTLDEMAEEFRDKRKVKHLRKNLNKK